VVIFGYTKKMSRLGLAPAASNVLPILPNLKRSSAGTTFPSSVSSRNTNRRKGRARSIRDGGDGGLSDSKKHNQSARQGKLTIFSGTNINFVKNVDLDEFLLYCLGHCNVGHRTGLDTKVSQRTYNSFTLLWIRLDFLIAKNKS
jgi:hypothetical protein